MKTKLLFLGFIIAFFFNGSVNGQIVPNGNFSNGVTGWIVTGNNLNLTGSPNIDQYAINSGAIGIVNATSVTETFVLKSSTFSLLANEVYDLTMIYGHYTSSLGGGMGVEYITVSQISSISLKDNQGNLVKTINLTNCSTNAGLNDPQIFTCDSNDFSVSTSDSYFLEIIGSVGKSNDSGIIPNEFFIFDEIDLNKKTGSHSVLGKVPYDLGNNNCASSSSLLQSIQVKTTGNNGIYYTATDSAGEYAFNFDENGSTTTEIINQGLSSSPTNHSNTFTSGTASIINNQDFCTSSSTTGDDVSVVIIPTSDVRPGFKSRYRIQYTNTGSTTVSGNIVLTFENNRMHSPVANPVVDNSSVNSLTWNYSGLLPFEIRTIDVEFENNTPTQTTNSLVGGENLYFTANITPLISDINQTDNSFALNHLVVNSYDPNDATILEGPQITAVQATQDLHFRLRFQNTGTASAININVKSMLDADLDWATFTPIAASHSYNTSLNSTTGEVNFSFPNINLADSTSNEPASHGWVLFKAKPKSNFAIGDTIDCGADIFFDYNMPIITNVATTQIHIPSNNYTLIPDSAFEQALIDLGHDNVIDGKVLTANINTITSLGLDDPVNHSNFPNVTTKITDLTGIEDFTALETLTAGDNNLTRVDFSKNLNLKILQLPKNNISYINISKNINLEFLNLRNNNLTKLDVSMLPNLGGLSIYNNPDLEVLNVKNGNTAPWQLFLAYNTPKLTCVEVDDVNFFNSNFPSHSSTNTHTSYNTNCNYPTTNVPDSVFENYLETHDRDGNTVSLGDATSMGNGIANDQKVFTYRICNVIQLDVSGETIGVLTGLEDFRDLEVFGFLGGSTTITNMDLSNNTKLKKIHSGLLSNLSTITLGNLPDLTFLQFGYDNVSNIDISGLPNLGHFNASQSKLTSLNTINNHKLRVLGITSPIKHLNVSSNTLLETLGVGSNLETLNIANGNNNNLTLSIQGNSNLTCITADATTPSTGLTGWTIDSQHIFSATLCANSLTYVPDDNFENYLETHDANGNVVTLGDAASMGNGIANDDYVFTNRINTVTKLEVPNLSIVDMTGIEDFAALIYLDCSTNSINSINVTLNLLLEDFRCDYNSLSNLDISKNLKLFNLSASRNQIETLDVSFNLDLKKLELFDNKLNTLDVTKNLKLEHLGYGKNLFSTSVNTSLNTSLGFLRCDYNTLSTIDVSSNINLFGLVVGDSNIASLDLSQNNKLETLSVLRGKLTSLNLSTNTLLRDLALDSNQLIGLDLSLNSSLETALLVNNQFTSLNIANGNNTNITTLDITNNSGLTCIKADASTPATGLTGWVKDNQHMFSANCSSNTAPVCVADTYSTTENTTLTVTAANGLLANDTDTDGDTLTIIEIIFQGNSIPPGGNFGAGGINYVKIHSDGSYRFTPDTGFTGNFPTITYTISDGNGGTSSCTLDISVTTAQQITLIPDANFEQFLINQSIDSDGVINGQILTSDTNGISSLGSMRNRGISDLTGIEAFKDLNIIDCRDNALTYIDLSSNTKLKFFYGDNNQFVNLDFSSNSLINNVTVQSNNLKSLNFNNGLNSITFFDARYNSNLECIEVFDVAYMSSLSVGMDSQMSYNTDCSSVWTINVSAATLAVLLAITPSIDTNGNGEITLAEAAAYTSPIDLSGQNLTSVEGLQAFTNVTQINLQNNNITDFSPLTDASIPFIQKSTGKTKVESRTGAFNLEELNISNNIGVQSLDVSKLIKLKKLIIKDNPDLITVNLKNGNNATITDFDSSNTPKLTCILVDDINANYLSNWTKDTANTFVTDEADCRTRVLSITQENLNQYISLYPNPIKDFLTVKLSNQLELKKVTVLNLLGKEVIKSNEEKVNLRNLPSGIYLLKVTTDKGIVTKKIIKE